MLLPQTFTLLVPLLQLLNILSRRLRKTGCLRIRRGQPLETKLCRLKDNSSCPYSCLSTPNGFHHRSSPHPQSFIRFRRIFEPDPRGSRSRAGSYNSTMSPHLCHHCERFKVNSCQPCRYTQVHPRWCRTPRDLPSCSPRFQSDDPGNALARKGQPKYRLEETHPHVPRPYCPQYSRYYYQAYGGCAAIMSSYAAMSS